MPCLSAVVAQAQGAAALPFAGGDLIHLHGIRVAVLSSGGRKLVRVSSPRLGTELGQIPLNAGGFPNPVLQGLRLIASYKAVANFVLQAALKHCAERRIPVFRLRAKPTIFRSVDVDGGRMPETPECVNGVLRLVYWPENLLE